MISHHASRRIKLPNCLINNCCLVHPLWLLPSYSTQLCFALSLPSSPSSFQTFRGPSYNDVKQFHLLCRTSQLMPLILANSTTLFFVILCCHLICSIHLKHRHWKLFSSRSLFLVIFQVSQPYSGTGQAKALNRRILVLLPISLVAQTLLSLWNASRTSCRRCIMSLLPPPSLSTIALRYVNSSTSSTSSPLATIFSPLLAHSVLRVLHFLTLSLIDCWLLPRNFPSIFMQVIELR